MMTNRPNNIVVPGGNNDPRRQKEVTEKEILRRMENQAADAEQIQALMEADASQIPTPPGMESNPPTDTAAPEEEQRQIEQIKAADPSEIPTPPWMRSVSARAGGGDGGEQNGANQASPDDEIGPDAAGSQGSSADGGSDQLADLAIQMLAMGQAMLTVLTEISAKLDDAGKAS